MDILCKTAKPIEMPFGGLTRGSKAMLVGWELRLDEFVRSYECNSSILYIFE